MDRDHCTNNSLRPVLEAYPAALQSCAVECLGAAGGFSGAEFWRLKTARGMFCLRRWPPEHPSAARLSLIHSVLRHAAEQGLNYLPVPLKATSGQTFVEHGGRLWELTLWLPGEGSFSREPRPARLCAALVALARFHTATAHFPHDACRVAPSQGISARLDHLRDCRSGGFQPPPIPTAARAWAGSQRYVEVIELFQRLAPQLERELVAAQSIATRLQPVIRDIHADHVLFTGDTVTGLVDFGGLKIDTPATDVARLLGSLAGDDPAAWQMGLAAYESTRPLASAERQLVPLFDRSTVALSGMNWLRWLFVEQRTFASAAAIDARLALIVQRMRAALNPK